MARARGQGGAWDRQRERPNPAPCSELRGSADALRRTGMLRRKSVAVLGSLRREGKGEAGFAQTKVRGSSLVLSAIP